MSFLPFLILSPVARCRQLCGAEFPAGVKPCQSFLVPTLELEGFEVTAALAGLGWAGFRAVGAVELSGSRACRGALWGFHFGFAAG